VEITTRSLWTLIHGIGSARSICSLAPGPLSRSIAAMRRMLSRKRLLRVIAFLASI